jgi:hypothetical protein
MLLVFICVGLPVFGWVNVTVFSTVGAGCTAPVILSTSKVWFPALGFNARDEIIGDGALPLAISLLDHFDHSASLRSFSTARRLSSFVRRMPVCLSASHHRDIKGGFLQAKTVLCLDQKRPILSTADSCSKGLFARRVRFVRPRA